MSVPWCFLRIFCGVMKHTRIRVVNTCPSPVAIRASLGNCVSHLRIIARVFGEEVLWVLDLLGQILNWLCDLRLQSLLEEPSEADEDAHVEEKEDELEVNEVCLDERLQIGLY